MKRQHRSSEARVEMRTTRAITAALLSGALMAASIAAQQAATTTPSPEAPATSTALSDSIQQDLEGVLEQPVGENEYHYDPQGRRDPFRSLIGPATAKVLRENAPPGVAGFLIEELDLQGVVRTKQGLVGLINGPDNNGYLLRVGDKVFDGEVVRITPTTIVFRQETREIVKELTPQSERRQ
jgi:Tfp pilus assembly protein PilP